jgi:hypothetical protein
VIVTPSISGAATAPNPSPAQPANTSLADLLFASAPANSAADFRTIAASLFGVESSTTQPTQTPAKDAAAAKKPASDLSADKSGAPKNNKEASDSTSTNAPLGLLVPLQTAPLQLPQISAKPDANDNKTLTSSLNHQSIALGLLQLPEEAQIKNLAIPTGPGATKPADDIPSSGSNDDGSLATQPSGGEDSLKAGKQIAAQTALPIANPPTPSVVPAKSGVAHSQPPVAPPTTKQPLVSGTSTKQTPPVTAPTVPESLKKPLTPVATDSVPVAPPQPSSDLAAKAILDSSSSIKSVSQSELVNPGPLGGSKNPSSREASTLSSKIKDRDSKDSSLAPAQSSKPGFTPPAQVVAPPTNSDPGNNKDLAGMPSSPHATAHGKVVPSKDAAALPAAATLVDMDAPDESLPIEITSGIATAKLVQGMNQSEFRVGMQSQEFGSIDIRTSVVHHMFSAQISVEHGDMAKSLSAQLPGLYHRLADQQVTVGNIVIQGQSLSTSSGLAQDAQRQSSQPAPGITSAKAETEPILPTITGGIDSAGRLDIRI